MESKNIKAKKTPKAVSLTIPVVDMTGKANGSIDLPSEMFAVKLSDKLLSLYVRVFLNNRKFNAPSTKTRSEVNGSTRKIYKQKGTGRARHGANTAPIFVGGGIAHGPRPILKTLGINKKQRTKALFLALSKAFESKTLTTVVDTQGLTGKSKELDTILKNITQGTEVVKKMLIVHSGRLEKEVKQAATNLQNVRLSQSETLNAYDVLRCNSMMFTKLGLEQFITIHLKTKTAK